MTSSFRSRTSRLAAGALLAGLALPAAACAGYQTDPGVKHYAPSESRQDVATKIDFVQHDLCYTSAAQHGTERCDRYLTQVRNIALSATDATVNPPQITGPAHTLEQRVQDLLGKSCLPPQPGNAQQCTESLQAVNKALADLKTALATG